jgi:hypothetical protein
MVSGAFSIRTAVSGTVALLFLWTPLEVEARDLFSYRSSGTFPSGRTYTIRVEEHPYVARPGEQADDGSRWGIDGGLPSSYCSVFELSLDGKKLRLPRKLFEDLSHLSSVKVSENGRAVELAIVGGDAAGSFMATMIVQPNEVERVVRHGEFPDSIWERLVVHNSIADDVQ